MALDPTIPLGVQTPQPIDIGRAIALAQSLQDRQALAQERQVRTQELQQQQAQQAAARQILQQSTDPETGVLNSDTAAKRLDAIGLSDYAEKVRKSADETIKAHLDDIKTQATLRDQQISDLQREAGTVQSQGAYQQFVTHVAQTWGPATAAQMPATYTPEFMQEAMNWGETQQQRLARLKDAAASADKKPTTAKEWLGLYSQFASAAQSPDEANTMLAGFQHWGMPDDLAAMVKGKSPDELAQMSITPEQRQQTATQQAGQAETARHNKVMEGIDFRKLDLTSGTSADAETVAGYVRQLRDPLSTITIQQVPETGGIRNAVVKQLQPGELNKLTAQGKQMKETATTLLPLIDKVQGLAQQLDSQGLMGTIGGRERSFSALESAAADLKGLTPQQRKLVGEFASAGGLLITGIARAHGGARAGGSPQMVEHLSKLMDAGNKDINTFLGNLQGERDFMSAYSDMGATKPAAGKDPLGIR